jgi:hypothetical protein
MGRLRPIALQPQIVAEHRHRLRLQPGEIAQERRPLRRIPDRPDLRLERDEVLPDLGLNLFDRLRHPESLNKSRQEGLDKLADFPLFETILRERDALAGLEDTGMLHLSVVKCAEISPILATHFRSALTEGGQFANEVASVLEVQS